jgi:hypothetical protein
MTDQEHASAIKEALKALNLAVAAGHTEGLRAVYEYGAFTQNGSTPPRLKVCLNKTF